MGLSEVEYDHLYNYLACGVYPTGSSKNQRRIIHRKCIEHFRVEDDVLYHSTRKASKTARVADREWRIVVWTEKERIRIIKSCHGSSHGRNS